MYKIDIELLTRIRDTLSVCVPNKKLSKNAYIIDKEEEERLKLIDIINEEYQIK